MTFTTTRYVRNVNSEIHTIGVGGSRNGDITDYQRLTTRRPAAASA